MFTALYTLWAALAWRFRGGGLVPLGSTQAARLLGAACIAIPLAVMVWDPWLLLLIPALWVGLAIFGWGDFYDMTTTAGESREILSPLVRWLGPKTLAHDIIGLSLTVAVILGPSAALLWWCGYVWWAPLLAGVAFGPLYWAAWRVPQRISIPWLQQPEPWMKGYPTGELLGGAALGLALALAVL